MRNFTADELKARKVLVTAARSLTNVERQLQPLWDKALAKNGIDMKSFKNTFNTAKAEVVNTEEFSFLKIGNNSKSSKAILMITPPQMVVESQNIFKGKMFFRNSYIEGKRVADTFFGMISDDGFTLEFNAKLIKEIHGFEIAGIVRNNFLNVPLIMISGMFINVFSIRFEKFHFDELINLQDDIEKGFEQLVSDYSFGSIHKDAYLRPWTHYDITG